MAPATRGRGNPSAKARANATAARRYNPRLRSTIPLPRSRSPTSGPQGGADPEQADETPAVLALRQKIKAARQANTERELELELQRIEAQGTALGQALGSDLAPPGDPRIQSMVARYPFIDTNQVANIFKNEFRAVNIFKLVNNHRPIPASKQSLRLTPSGELRAHDDDATQQDLKGMVPFLRCLGVYNQCIIEAANEQLRNPLQVSLAWYVDYLHELHLHYTFESVRTFHFHFHEIRMIKGVNDPDGWYNAAAAAAGERGGRALVKKTPVTTFQTGNQGQRTRKQAYGPRPDGGSTWPPVCNRFNGGSCTYPSCKYQHICSGCGGTHTAINCRTSNLLLCDIASHEVNDQGITTWGFSHQPSPPEYNLKIEETGP